MDQRIVVIEFETTGLSARSGDRALEVAAVEIVDGQVGRHFASLINPGVAVPSFISGLTGIITNGRFSHKALRPAVCRGRSPACLR